MRELVYVSRRKLLEFREEKSSAGWMRRLRSLGLKAPLSMGEVSLALGEPEEAPAVSLERVVSFLEEKAVWYKDIRKLQPGVWIHFEAKMNFATTSLNDGQLEPGNDGPLVFWEPEPSQADRVGSFTAIDDPRYDPLADVRLVLHASADGLIGGGHPEVFVQHEPPRPEDPTGVPHDSAWLWNRNFTKTEAFFQVLQAMKRFDDPEGQPRRILERAVHSLDHYIPPLAASWMAGYARVTVGLGAPYLGTTLVATPLYVERVAPPQAGDAGYEDM